ncbi:dockerin type I repeat-containing protein [Ruminococcus difficilis]|uniref:Dockerin domain-containing protein n=1 Tax=Ruminococcus difficilis TaxID=2763069 RepID=A0A934WPK0_9FIRM|nr:dockerin type I repeat-containing protein [Ruminococcus difficilis]MBK6088176.1 hypothetical protein [Ruminococcus difficilis]
MKRVIALCLVLIMLFSCGAVAASAESNDDYLKKLTPALIQEINDPSEVMIGVYIFLKPCPDKQHVEEIISQKYTWTNQQEHLMYYRKEMSAIIGAYVQGFIDDNADLLYKVICQTDAAEFIIAEVSKDNVPKLAQLDIVQDMDTYGSYSTPTAITEMIAPAANEQYYDPRHTITARDIDLRDYYQFRDSDVYAVHFYVRNLCYYTVMIEERIGDWLLECSHPEPFLFVNDRLYGFKEAYDAGLMTDDMLEELAGSSFKGDYVLPLLTRYIKGDADGDGGVSIIDATCVQRHEAGIATTSFFKPLADVDGDSEVNVIDATLIQRSKVGLYTIE